MTKMDQLKALHRRMLELHDAAQEKEALLHDYLKEHDGGPQTADGVDDELQDLMIEAGIAQRAYMIAMDRYDEEAKAIAATRLNNA